MEVLDRQQVLGAVFFSTAEKLSTASLSTVMIPRTNTMLRPAFTTSPRHSSSEPSATAPTNSLLKVAVTLRLSFRASRAITNRQ